MSTEKSLEISDDLLETLAFIPCQNKEDLHNFIKVFFGFDIPDTVVHPESNSSPMDFIWEVYSKALEDNDPDFSRVLVYASRDSFKTFSASLIEVLLLLHTTRQGAHGSAIEPQAGYALDYMRTFLSKPMFQKYVVGDSKRVIQIVRFLDPATGKNYTEKEYGKLPISIKNKLKRIDQKTEVVVGTRTAMNGKHSGVLYLDEADLFRPDGYEEAKLIPSPIGCKFPLTIIFSTRKTATGIVQKEINEAINTGLQIRHWNIVDVTQKCPEDRYLPDQPKQKLWVNDETLKHIKEAEYQDLSETEREKWIAKEAFAGCVKCPLFAMCQGNLATRQKSESPLLKDIHKVIQDFKKVSPETAQAQLMCRKPESSGLVYSLFDIKSHVVSANKMAQILLGLENEPTNFDKSSFVELCQKNGCQMFTGMDFGFTHDFAVVSGFVFGPKVFIVDVIALPGLELEDKIKVSQKVKEWNSIIFGDPESPSDIATFRRKGFIMKSWSKGRGSVKEGIEAIRSKLWNRDTNIPDFYILAGDRGCEKLANRMATYSFKLDNAGNVTDYPDDKEDDVLDAVRYLVSNAFKNTKITSIVDPVKNQDEIYFDKPTTSNYVQYFIDQALGNTEADDVAKEGPMRGSDPTGINWDME